MEKLISFKVHELYLFLHLEKVMGQHPNQQMSLCMPRGKMNTHRITDPTDDNNIQKKLSEKEVRICACF